MFFRNSPKQPDNVLSHWFVPMDGLQFSAVDFYTGIEKDLAERKVPRLRRKHVEYHEGSRLSDKRLYLRLARERFSFEVCAAPFGTGYFFSLRFVEIPRGGWIMLLLLLAATGVVLGLLGQVLHYMTFFATGWFWLALGLADIAGIVIASQLHRQRVARLAATEGESIVDDTPGMPDFDSFLLSLPVIGEWYERFRKATFYRHDTRLMFHLVVSEVVQKRVEELTAAKGVKLLRTYDHDPILRGFYRSSSVTPGSHEDDLLSHGDD